jgi:predicted aldo/keto reductase-like oxidoreductase
MKPKNHNRRQFIKNLSLAMLGTSALGRAGFARESYVAKSGSRAPRIMNYKTLGRTGFKVSDIASGAPNNEAVLKAMLNAGVNFIDTGHAYGNGNNERLIGKVLKDYDRKKIFINTKLHVEGKAFESREQVVRMTRDALERLQTDYVDCVMIHSADNSTIVTDESFHAGMQQLKAEGRVRSTGVSCHGSAWYLLPEETIDKVLLTAAETNRFDVFEMTYNFVNKDVANKIFDACDKKNIGRAIIKSSPVQIYKLLEKAVARYEEEGEDPGKEYYAYFRRYEERAEKARDFFKKYGYTTDDELINAAIIYVLQDFRAHTVCLDIRNLEQVSRYLSLSGQSLRQEQAGLLNDYQDHFGFLNCHIGCNACEKACPHHVPVNHILRYHYYYQNKKDEKEAMKLYGGLPPDKRAGHCLSCPGYCEEACPNGVSARQLMTMAHRNLSLDQESFA